MEAMNNDDELRGDQLRQEVSETWNRNADYWDARMGEGNEFHKLLIECDRPPAAKSGGLGKLGNCFW